MNDTLVIVPTYNERENVAPLVESLLTAKPDTDLLFVDDGSPDGTGDLIASIGAQEPRVHLERRAGKLGLGTAYIHGFHWALARSYRRILQMDGDLSHDPKYVPILCEHCDAGADLVLGSRWTEGGGTRNWGIGRRVLSRGGSLYARSILGLPIRDLTGGFKCWKRETLERIDLGAVRSEGYSFQIEMTWRALGLGARVEEVPIVFVDRTIGKSKMSRRIVIEAVAMVWKLRLGMVR